MTSMPMPTATAEPFVPPTLQNGTAPPGETEPLRSAYAYDGWYPVISSLFLVPWTLECYHQRAKDDNTTEVSYLCCCWFCIPVPCPGREDPVEWRREGNTNKPFVLNNKMKPHTASGPGYVNGECEDCPCFQLWHPCKLNVCSFVATILLPICRCRRCDDNCFDRYEWKGWAPTTY